MQLSNLSPQFIRREVRADDGYTYHVIVRTIGEAQGVMFLCPKCYLKNGGREGTHRIICWSRSRGVPDAAIPGPGRWTLDGTDYSDLTLNGDPPGEARSIKLYNGCGWHGHVTDGIVT